MTTAERPIIVEQIEQLPESSHSLPGDEYYVQLGCVACPKTICFKAVGMNGSSLKHSRTPLGTEAMVTLLSGVEKQTSIHTFSSSIYDEACIEPCPQAEDMEASVELLNEQFGSNLTIPA